MSHGPEIYQSSLPCDSTQVRLLRLEPCPGDLDTEVICSLVPVALDNAPEFEALSYAWGDQKDLKPILINGNVFSVTRNLESALRHLRRRERPRLLWVDAICINQENMTERSSQVAMMHDIYQSALRTVSWLGEGGEDGEFALEFLHWFARRKKDADSTDVDEDYIAQGRGAVTALMQRPYWRRLWVMQEISFSQVQPRICCGTRRIQWGTLVTAVEDWESANFVKRLHRVRGATKELVRQGSTDRPSRNGRHIIFLLSYSAGFETSEPRDRVYALYGLMRVAGIVDFEPDYSNSVPEVYQQITEFVLRMKSSLNVLEMRSHEQGNDLPSWVIDFSKPPAKSFTKSGGPADWHRIDDRKQLAIPDMTIDSEATILNVSGAVVDQIVSVHPVSSCVASALTRAAQDPNSADHGRDVLRSSTRAACLYWEQFANPHHTVDLCKNLFEFMTSFKTLVAHLSSHTNQEAGGLPDWYPRIWDLEHGAVDCTSTTDQPSNILGLNYQHSLQQALCTLSLRLHGRICFRTRQGFLGAALAGVQIGDEIIAFQSTKQLHVLRKRQDELHIYAGAAVLVAPGGSEHKLSAIFARIRKSKDEDQKFCVR